MYNIDGLPLSKSSSSQLYPILCNLFDNRRYVDVVGIYHGYDKPKQANEFLSEFVNDCKDIANEGIVYKGHMFSIKSKAFICDVPAKAFIRYSKGHNGYFSCTKCKIEGAFMNNRICFPNLNGNQIRTDSEFKLQLNKDHHTGTSILQDIPGINMIDDFPLDYMHLICPGVIKKTINFWCYGKPSVKLPFQNIENISNSLLSKAKNIPSEFNRKPRSLSEVKRWKATEFRQFLLYAGPVVLKSNLSIDRYINFLSLHCAVFILSSTKYED